MLNAAVSRESISSQASQPTNTSRSFVCDILVFVIVLKAEAVMSHPLLHQNLPVSIGDLSLEEQGCYRILFQVHMIPSHSR